MKLKQLNFLDGINSPIDGEKSLKNFCNAKVIIGVDEVGRGPLAGPVVACAAILDESFKGDFLNDSKKISKKKREFIFESVKEACSCYAIASASVQEIDSTNILEANFLAMRRALSAIGVQGLPHTNPELPIECKGEISSNENFLIAVDGNLFIREVPQEIQIPIIKGDGKIASISAASILAKVYRDRLMEEMSEKFPVYDFAKNAGYGTKKHLEALEKYGFSPIHRRTFRPKNIIIPE